MEGEVPAAAAPAASLLEEISAVFGSLGRALICLDQSFQVLHASRSLDRLVAAGAAERAIGRSAGQLLGEGLFGRDGTLRGALRAGERREGWGATLELPGLRPRLVSISCAPLRHEPGARCDPRVAYLVVVRASGEANESTGASAPTLFSGLLARSPAMLKIFELIEHLAESDATVLVTGESGTGKELIARAIHLHSRRRSERFVAVNCGAIPEQLLESELFGHVKGAFTGAVRDREGRFQLAGAGTLFLDEIGDLPLQLQVKLLRVLQERTFERVGESVSRRSEARIIAATNADLRRACLEGTFREDLFYRLRVVPIEVPPLRERREDVEPLARHLLERVGARYDRALRLAPDAVRALLRYSWPGNVRELENALEFALAVCRGQTIHSQDLPPEIAEPPAVSGGAEAGRPDAAAAPGPDPEAATLRAALDAHGWRRAEAARALGISRTTLWRRMREHRLVP